MTRNQARRPGTTPTADPTTVPTDQAPDVTPDGPTPDGTDQAPAASDGPTGVPTVPAPWTPDQAQIDYAAAEGPAKVTIRNRARSMADAAVMADDIDTAKTWLAAVRAMVPATAQPSGPDYGALMTARARDLIDAAAIILTGQVRPAGVPDEFDLATWADAQVTLFDGAGFVVDGWLADTSRTVSADAAALAGAKVARSADRQDIGDVVRRAFDGQPSGTVLTIAQVCKRGALPHYTPGSGAVAARMFGAGTGVTGFVAVEGTATAPRSIRKA